MLIDWGWHVNTVPFEDLQIEYLGVWGTCVVVLWGVGYLYCDAEEVVGTCIAVLGGTCIVVPSSMVRASLRMWSIFTVSSELKK